MSRARPATLPIDAAIPEIVASLQARPNLVIVAEPGAGKTTRVPPALLAAGLTGSGQIAIAQPRRIAARLAAMRVADELGEPVGQRCGYQVRFESAISPRTKIRYVTEGLLLRQLRDDPSLRDVAVVILDELHERHVETDLLLALVRRAQTLSRSDLRIVAMSATLHAEPVAALLDAPVVRVPGRAFAVEIDHVERGSDRALGSQVADGLRRLDDPDGSVLVFLPGAREIREATTACEPVARALDLEIATLHGDLPAAEQDRAVRPGARRKLVLATNVAETSVTIEGVTAVIDSGLARRPAHDPWSGIATLTLAKISKASAIQRAGRAGRTAPGRCLRLFTKHDFDRRVEHDEPEIARADLAAALLDLRAAGVRDVAELAWLLPPPAAAVQAAEALLRRLGAIERDGALTSIGRAMLRYPVHPRIARLLVEGHARGIGSLAADAAALLGERPIRRFDPRRVTATKHHVADVLADLDRLRGSDRDESLDRGAVHAVRRAQQQLRALLPRAAIESRTPHDDLCCSLLVAFPDRVARAQVRAGLPDRLVLAAGGEAELAADSVVAGSDLVVALAIETRDDRSGKSRTIVRSAAQIEPEWLLEVGDDALREEVIVRFDPERERVEAFTETRYDALVVDRTPCAELPASATAVLRDAALAAGVEAFVADPRALADLLARMQVLRSIVPEVAPITSDDVRDVLAAMCEGRKSFADLRRADLLAHVRARLSASDAAALERSTPAHVSLPGGRRLNVHYEPDRPPWIASRLQDFFGMQRGPTIGSGRIALVIHLLAPNQRAVQVTTDLDGFWSRHYPDLRRTLMRRYPKHAWPEDPRTARPPEPRPPRKRS